MRPTWFALEGQDGLDLGLFPDAGTALGVHQPDVVSWQGLRRREEAAQTDGIVAFI